MSSYASFLKTLCSGQPSWAPGITLATGILRELLPRLLAGEKTTFCALAKPWVRGRVLPSQPSDTGAQDLTEIIFLSPGLN